jgi:hypothetical protein
MIRIPPSALAATAAGSFTVAFAVSVLSSAPGEAPRTAVRMEPARAISSPVVAERARLRSVGSLPALHIPAPPPAPAAPTPAATPEPTPVAPATDTSVPPGVAPAPVAPAPVAPAPAPEPSAPPPEPGPIFDSSG